ncbi:MAG TPA: DUF488 family protein [bacterium]|nr:DUF488 family protein [bacterium]
MGLKRAYDPPGRAAGPWVLVDRVWPRGVSKQRLRIVAWLREIAPSAALRGWFGHDPARWDEFRRRYRAELAGKPGLLDELAGYARGGSSPSCSARAIRCAIRPPSSRKCCGAAVRAGPPGPK